MNHPPKIFIFTRPHRGFSFSFSFQFVLSAAKTHKEQQQHSISPFVVFALIFINAPLRHNEFVKSTGEMEAYRPRHATHAGRTRHCIARAEPREEKSTSGLRWDRCTLVNLTSVVIEAGEGSCEL